MRRFIRYVVFGWNSPSNLDEPPAAATMYTRWRQWRRRDQWPGSFGRMMIDGFNAGWEDGQRNIAQIYAKHGLPYSPESPPWYIEQKRAGTDTAPPPAE